MVHGPTNCISLLPASEFGYATNVDIPGRDATVGRGGSIAVVIPAYNCAPFVEEALRSVEAQTRLPERVVVVDDGSRDGTGRIVSEFAAHSSLAIELLAQSNRGAAAARNAGLARCSEDLIAFLDGDDTFYSTFLERMEDALVQHPDLILCFSDKDVVTAHGAFIRRDLDHPAFRAIGFAHHPDGVCTLAENTFVALIPGSFISMGLMTRRSAIQRIGAFDEELRAAEDKLFLMKLAKLGPFGFVDDPLGTWRRHDSNASGPANAFIMAYYDDLVLAKLASDERVELTDLEREAIRTQRSKNATQLLYAASNEARPEFPGLACNLIREHRAPFWQTLKGCIRYGVRRLGPGRSYGVNRVPLQPRERSRSA